MGEQISFDPNLISEPKPRKSKTVTPTPVEENFDNPASFVDVQKAATPVKRGRSAADINTIKQGLTQAFGMAGMGVSMWNTYDGLTIGMNADTLAEQWAKVAENNPAVKKWLLRVLKGGDLAGAIMVTLGVAVAIAANHDVVDPKIADLTKPIGVKTPSKDVEPLIGHTNGNGTAASS